MVQVAPADTTDPREESRKARARSEAELEEFEQELEAQTKVLRGHDFDSTMDLLARTIAVRAVRLPKTKVAEQIDAFKALTQYKMVVDKFSAGDEGDEGSGIAGLRQELLGTAPAANEGAPEETPPADESTEETDDE